MTAEDPVEFNLNGINQVQMKDQIGLNFASTLRSFLRQDPNIILVGEIRDFETAEIAIKAALTGHLVLSTLHTNDAASTITRMIDMGVDPFMVASATLLVSAQRLIRRLCPSCKESYDPPAERLRELGFSDEEIKAKPKLHRPKGCGRCGQSGYAGRFALLETLPVTEGIKRMVIDGHSAIEIRNKALEEGMISLRRCAILNAIRGNTSIEEVLRVTLSDHRRTRLPEEEEE